MTRLLILLCALAPLAAGAAPPSDEVDATDEASDEEAVPDEPTARDVEEPAPERKARPVPRARVSPTEEELREDWRREVDAHEEDGRAFERVRSENAAEKRTLRDLLTARRLEGVEIAPYRGGADEEEEVDAAPGPKAGVGKKKGVAEAAAKKGAKKKAVVEEEEAAPAPKKGAKKKAVVEEEEDEAPAPKKGAKKKAVVEEEEDEAPAPAAKKKKPVVEDEADEAPAKRPKKRAPVVEEE